MALITRRYKLFWFNTFFSPENAFISMCLRQHFYSRQHGVTSTAIEILLALALEIGIAPKVSSRFISNTDASRKWCREHRDINALFCLKTLANQKSVSIDQWNSHYFSFIKVTCPFHIFLFFSYRNTIGNIPVNWYDDYPHIGYDLDGKQIRKPKVKHLNLEWSVEVSSCA